MHLYRPQAHQHRTVIIGLSGRAGAGKSTVAAHLREAHGYVEHAFAEPLRDMLAAMLASTPINAEALADPARKQQPLPHLHVTPRRLLQTLGTEWGRWIDQDLWVKLAALTLGLHDLPHSTPVHTHIVLSDVRFPNEARWIRTLGGEVWHISRPADGCHQLGEAAQHPSEHQGRLHDVELGNDGSMAGLFDLVDCELARMALRRLRQPQLPAGLVGA